MNNKLEEIKKRKDELTAELVMLEIESMQLLYSEDKLKLLIGKCFKRDETIFKVTSVGYNKIYVTEILITETWVNVRNSVKHNVSLNNESYLPLKLGALLYIEIDESVFIKALAAKVELENLSDKHMKERTQFIANLNLF